MPQQPVYPYESEGMRLDEYKRLYVTRLGEQEGFAPPIPQARERSGAVYHALTIGGLLVCVLGAVLGGAAGADVLGVALMALGFAAIIVGIVAINVMGDSERDTEERRVATLAASLDPRRLCDGCMSAPTRFLPQPGPPAQQTSDIPNPNSLVQRIAGHAGRGYPLLDPAGAPDYTLSPAWRVPDAASPLAASPGRVVRSLILTTAIPQWEYAVDITGDNTTYYGSRIDDRQGTVYSREGGKDAYHLDFWPMRYFLVEFTGADGAARCVWSDALPGWFDDGESVTVYWYTVRGGDGAPFVRVHDVATAAIPVDVAAHAVGVCGRECVDGGRVPTNGNDHDNYFARERDASQWDILESRNIPRFTLGGSFGAQAAAQPWGQAFAVSGDLWYATDRARWLGAQGAGLDGRRRLTMPMDVNLVVGPHLMMDGGIYRDDFGDFTWSWDFDMCQGVAEQVVSIPLFTVRRYCGNGYMALVRFAWNGAQQEAWALCDPARGDSYLGDAEGAAWAPVHPGDPVVVWRQPRGLCLVAPAR